MQPSFPFSNPNVSLEIQVSPKAMGAIFGTLILVSGIFLALAYNQVLPHGVNAISNLGIGGEVLSYGVLGVGGVITAFALGMILKKKLNSVQEHEVEQQKIDQEQTKDPRRERLIEKFRPIGENFLTKLPPLEQIPILDGEPTVKNFKAQIKGSNVAFGIIDEKEYIAILMNDDRSAEGLFILKAEDDDKWSQYYSKSEDLKLFFSLESGESYSVEDTDFIYTMVDLQEMFLPHTKHSRYSIGPLKQELIVKNELVESGWVEDLLGVSPFHCQILEGEATLENFKSQLDGYCMAIGAYNDQKFIAILMNNGTMDNLFVLTSPIDGDQWSPSGSDPSFLKPGRYSTNDIAFKEAMGKIKNILLLEPQDPNYENAPWHVGAMQTKRVDKYYK